MRVPGSSRRRKLAVLAASTGLVAATALFGGWQAIAVQGNIDPKSIEIDQDAANSTTGANVYPGDSTKNCSTAGFSGPTYDWVKDCATNSDTASLQDSVATGLMPGLTSVTGGSGHWYGTRIVDGLNTNDQDIFLTGGKENDLSTWNIGAGSIGSSKYDVSQAYLANNSQKLFLGMERSGNNGTTAFDFEFDQNPSTDARQYLPTRTPGDVLLTFEMQGSGASGSAVPHYFIWTTNTSSQCATGLSACFVEQSIPTGLTSTINKTNNTPAPPWGIVDSNGNWVTGLTDPTVKGKQNNPAAYYGQFEFAEASVPLGILPGVNACGGNAYVQVRTRASAGDTSDMKDATKIFPYNFGGPTAKAQLSTNCNQQFTYGSAGSADASGGTAISYGWNITVNPATATLSGGGVSAIDASQGTYTSTSAGGTVDVNLNGADSATITVKNTVTTSSGNCNADSGNKTVTVYKRLGATATLTAQCDLHFGYSATATGGYGTYSYSWQFKKNGTNVGTPVSGASGTFDATSYGAGSYSADLTVTDQAAPTSSDGDVTTKGQCSKTVSSNAVNVYTAVGGSISVTTDCDNTFNYSATGTGGDGNYTYAFTLEKNVAGTWTTSKTFTTGPQAGSATGTLDIDSSGLNPNGEGDYRLSVTITDGQGINCHIDLGPTGFTVKDALTATAQKTNSNSTTANLSGSALSGGVATTGVSYQWQIWNSTTSAWANVSGATSATYNYSGFDATDGTVTSADVSDVVYGGDTYKGKLYTAKLRLHVSRTVNGNPCSNDSPDVNVKKLVVVDP